MRGYFVDADTGHPSNDFYLRPDEVRTLEFVVFDDTTDGAWADKMLARSLWDNQH